VFDGQNVDPGHESPLLFVESNSGESDSIDAEQFSDDVVLVDDVIGIVNDESEITDSKDITPLSAPDDLVQPESSQITKLVSEQKADESLTGAFDPARVNK